MKRFFDSQPKPRLTSIPSARWIETPPAKSIPFFRKSDYWLMVGMLEILFQYCALSEYQCRFKWTQGALAFWDNRATMHYALADYWPQTRLMHRVTIETDEIGAPSVEGLGEVA